MWVWMETKDTYKYVSMHVGVYMRKSLYIHALIHIPNVYVRRL